MSERSRSFAHTTATGDSCTFPAHVPMPMAAPRLSLLFYARAYVVAAELGAGESLVVGRSSDADLVIDDPSLSRRHARFSVTDDQLLLEDLGSKNGSRVGDQMVTRSRVQPGDRVTLGTVVTVVREAGQADVLGLDSYERFSQRLADELVRARGFQRPVSLLMVRAERAQPGHVSGWWQRLRAELRAVDNMTLYAPHAVLMAMPEMTLNTAREAASALLKPRPGEPLLLCGAVSFPSSGSSLEALLSAARACCRRATPEQPVCCPDHPQPVSAEAAARPLVRSPAMRELYRVAQRAAQGRVPVLILGETGTGKELLARSIHELGPRSAGPFKAQNCAAIPQSLMESTLFGHERGAFTGATKQAPGIFEEASSGTLLLDEVGELSASAQAGLLRVLETRRLSRVGGSREIEVDVRIVAATHRDLEAMVAAGTFRADLLHRLNLLTLHIPPLRERKEEIDELCERFLQEAASSWQATPLTIDEPALQALRSYSWPGNVRELRNVIERAQLMAEGPCVGVSDISEHVRRATRSEPGPKRVPTGEPVGSFSQRVRDYECELIRDALGSTGGSQKEAARLLDMPLRTLVYKIRAYGLR